MALGVLPDRSRDVLGVWGAEHPGGELWSRVVEDLKARGVERVLVAVLGGLEGLPERVSLILCARHTMSDRSEYAKQKNDESGAGRGGETAVDSRRAD
jgi:transposase-like protein